MRPKLPAVRRGTSLLLAAGLVGAMLAAAPAASASNAPTTQVSFYYGASGYSIFYVDLNRTPKQVRSFSCTIDGAPPVDSWWPDTSVAPGWTRFACAGNNDGTYAHLYSATIVLTDNAVLTVSATG